MSTTGRLDPTFAYEVLMLLLAATRDLGIDRTTPDRLHTPIRTWTAATPSAVAVACAPGYARPPSVARFVYRRRPHPAALRRPEGPEHTWIRLENRSRAEIEIVGAVPWPDCQQQAPGPAWWRCTGCRRNSGTHAQDLDLIRAQAAEHTSGCLARHRLTKGSTFFTRWSWRIGILTMGFPLIANSFGWIFTE
ncbi:hypothetical protein, partial [Kitasatospora sp. NPDC085879]|uniref:hypothetical protein n=1 Tax=Kitasatospora sp. NPDC085879 TaxID=3154769 RepID=UPI003446B70E